MSKLGTIGETWSIPDGTKVEQQLEDRRLEKSNQGKLEQI